MNVTSIHLAPKYLLEQDEAKRLAARFGKMIPDLNVGFAKQFRDKKKDLEKQTLQLERMITND